VDVCPEAVASEARKARQIKRFVAEVVDDLIRWSVVEALPPSPSLRQAKEALNRRSDPRCLICDLESPRRPASLVQDSKFVEKYSANIW
jgi:hypothetical protein